MKIHLALKQFFGVGCARHMCVCTYRGPLALWHPSGNWIVEVDCAYADIHSNYAHWKTTYMYIFMYVSMCGDGPIVQAPLRKAIERSLQGHLHRNWRAT